MCRDLRLIAMDMNNSIHRHNGKPRRRKGRIHAINFKTHKSHSKLTSKQKFVSFPGESRHVRQPLEGQLYKYTNVMKGWQYRWFVLEPNKGRLEYYEKEELKGQKPRGSVHLAGAVISPSDEDSQTFTVNASNGEIYRLRAIDAKERQHWVNRLRATAEHHTDSMAQNLPIFNKESRTPALSTTNQHVTHVQIKNPSGSLDSLHSTSANKSHHRHPSQTLISSVITASASDDCFKNVHEMLDQVTREHKMLINNIEELPSAEPISSLDKDMLLLKATSGATLSSLEQCLNILLHHQTAANQTNSLPHYTHDIEWFDPKPLQLNLPINNKHVITDPVSPAESYVSASDVISDSHTHTIACSTDNACDNCEVEDTEEYSDTELGPVEEHKSVILHLLSQLKLGMDLTKVVLPTFILEKRSLLELFADCMAHPDMFIRIPDLPDPQSRMLAVVEWYLTSFHAGRKGSIAKKPYNPIIGETFQCSWHIPNSFTSSPSQISSQCHKPMSMQNGVLEPTAQSNDQPGSRGDHVTEEATVQTENGYTKMFYCAEQVSHHPPVSAFYFECPEKRIYMNASIWTRSKFMGMSIGVVMVGKVRLSLVDLEEDYEFSLPSAYARSILTVPWVELGDKISITCQKTGYSAHVTFHTKPFYGGKLHRVTSEVKNPAGELVCKMSGEWNGTLEFTFTNGQTKVIDTTKMVSLHKRVRPVRNQSEFESRKLWQKVTENLKKGDIEAATQHKRYLEEKQRQAERHRKENNIPFPTKYFHKEGDTWVYNNVLKPNKT